MKAFMLSLFALCMVALSSAQIAAQETQEWQKTVAAAKKEGKVVVGGPPTPVLRKAFKDTFEKRFGIEMELIGAPGPRNARRAASEYEAGVSYFDVLHGGSGTLEPLMDKNMLVPLMDNVVLADSKDPSKWWGGHLWEDNVENNKYIYSYVADFATPPWYNASKVKADEIRSYDDLLDPKWKGKIGFFEPRRPSAGQGLWAFLMKTKGKDYLRKLAAQDLFITRDGKQLADALAKGKLYFGLGVSRRFVDPYIKAGLPIKMLDSIKEGMGGSNGFGTVGVLKNAPHPNAAKVYVTWLLSQEGQDLYGRALTQGSRRLDVDTKWLMKLNSRAAKDVMTPEEFEQIRFYGEDVIKDWRKPGGEFAKEILK